MSSEPGDDAAAPGESGGVGAERRSEPSPAEPSESTAAGSDEVVSDPSDAFQALGNEVRMRILEAMLERADGAESDGNPTFSELYEATDVETSAGFSYHLEQLVGPYLRKCDDGYAFTYAGRKIARAIASGTYTKRIDHPAVPLEDPCPFCEATALEARSSDNVVTIACGECDRSLLGLGFPPSGLEAHGDAFPGAFDRHHRHRLATFRDGVCPECSGDVDARLVSPTDDVADALPAELTDHVQAAFACRRCGHDVRCPVTLSLLEHPAVVSFYHERGEDVRDRPIWNVGREWTETVVSEDPLAVRVVSELEGDALALYVDERARVREVQRSERDAADEASTAA